MLVVTGEIVIADEDIEDAKGAAAQMAKATRDEPGCITYVFYQHIESPGHFRVYEEWEDENALRAHFEAPHMTEFRAKLSKMSILSRNIVAYTPTEIKTL